ncbi:MAG TPA: hypothetical protein VFB76_17270 [Candidatus Angelobacter sp.]|nr:hypothetical protein [Candidatus Angelobacter sp.]
MSRTYRIGRATVLGLMFILAVAAACTSDSYDPNPYDDVPPVVTVHYNYVLPKLENVRSVRSQGTNPTDFSRSVIEQQQAPALALALLEAQAIPTSLISPQLVIPLRR